MPVDKFNRGLILLPPQPEKIEYLRYDGKHYWCGEKKLQIIKTNGKFVRVNNKYKTGLEVNGRAFKIPYLVYLNKKKLITYYGSPFYCKKDDPRVCKFRGDGKQPQNWEPFKE